MTEVVTNQVLVDAFERIKQEVHMVLKKVDEAVISEQLNGKGNSVAWLIWHLTRVQDDHIAELRGEKQVWEDGWYDKFKLPFEIDATGYGHSRDDVAKVQASKKLLQEYYDAVHEVTVKYVETLEAKDYQRVVDKRWDPPVTLAVRLMSIISDDLQHVGQAAYIKGLLEK